MRMKTFQRFIALLKNLHGIHQQVNIQKERLICQIVKVRSGSLPQQKGGPVYVSAIFLYLLTYDAANVMDDDNLATALSAQIQGSILPIGTIRKPSVEQIILEKRWGVKD